MNLKPMARQLRARREKTGYTRDELAAKCGTTRTSIYRIETGRQIPSLYLLEKLAGALGLTVDVRLE